MAIYHLSCKVFSRSKGQTAIAAAAYRSGTKLEDYELGVLSDYTKKRGIVFSEVALCKNAPKEFENREVLWNAVQSVEKSKDAQLCREIEVALPQEFTLDEQINLVKLFTSSLTDEGMCVDVAIHDLKKGNPHAHMLVTMRSIDENANWIAKEKKVYSLDKNGNKIPIIDQKTGKQKIGAKGRKMWKRETVVNSQWNSKEKLIEWRKRWADYCNKAIKKKNFDIAENNLSVNFYAQESLINYIDHRSYADQGIDKVPTIHEGWHARKMGLCGMKSDRIDLNKQIREINDIDSSLNIMFEKYRKRNELYYQAIQKEVDEYELRIKQYKSDSKGITRAFGEAGFDHQNFIYTNAKNIQGERDAMEKFGGMQRRNDEDEGLKQKELSAEEILSQSIIIGNFNKNCEKETDDLLGAIFSLACHNKKKKKNQDLQLVR